MGNECKLIPISQQPKIESGPPNLMQTTRSRRRPGNQEEDQECRWHDDCHSYAVAVIRDNVPCERRFGGGHLPSLAFSKISRRYIYCARTKAFDQQNQCTIPHQTGIHDHRRQFFGSAVDLKVQDGTWWGLPSERHGEARFYPNMSMSVVVSR